MKITRKYLESQINTINTMLGTPLEPYTFDVVLKPSIGSYHISIAYGGYALHRLVNERGGVNDVFNKGHMTAKELSLLMEGFIFGMTLIKEMK